MLKLQNSNDNQTKNNTKTQMVTKLKENCNKTQKLKL